MMRAACFLGGVVTCLAVNQSGFADDLNDSSFFKDSETQILNRNFYFNRDYRNAASTSQSKRDEWAQGLIATFSSGYTPGAIGVGVDAIGMLGLKLDSSPDRINSGLLPSSGSGQVGVDRAQNEYSKAGGALKFKYSNTLLKYGEQQVNTPVFATGDNRLLPETVEGLYISSREIPGLNIEAAHFTSMMLKERTSRAASKLKEADLIGATYQLTKSLTAALYASSVQDYWDKKYLGLNWIKPIDASRALTMDFRFYDQKSIGQALGGDLDNKSFSLRGSYAIGAHKFTLAGQRIQGKGGYTFYVDGGSTNYMPNFIQYAEFTREDERSWQARYDFSFAGLNVPGLDFMVRYVRGDNIKVPGYDDAQKEWERNVELGYTVQSGPLKNLNFRLKHANYRNSFNSDLDDVRFITQYPINL
ncbi:OprD family porin [Pseudomonas sp. nanlin1]|uniref:OprD family porin n=1 Tax=Pseudomonas sp. nanlin1 TaxID=3040605 RepID=UPI0038900C6F